MKGFTLIEMVVVIAVIALIAAVAMPLITTQVKQAKIRATKSEMENLEKALLNYYKDVFNQEVGPPSEKGHIFPEDTDREDHLDLAALEYKEYVSPDNSDIKARWDGPYIEASKGRYGYGKDAWGNSYRYNYELGEIECSLRSAGPDEVFDTSDDIPSSSDPPYTINGKVVLGEKIEMVKQELEKIKKAAQEYYEDTGNYPEDSGPSGCTPGGGPPPCSKGIDDLVNEGYIQQSYQLDEWGRRYEEQGEEFISLGPDGKFTPGGGPNSDNIEPY